jgi:putative ABC transport system substrate-binding protein
VGRNLAIEYRFSDPLSGRGYDQLLNLAAELVQRQVAVIVAVGTGPALAAEAVTTTLPIVGIFGTDPVDAGAVSSLNRPAGNITGVYPLSQALTAKRFQLLHEIAPSARSIGLLVKPAAPITEAEKRDAETAARTLGVQLAILDASTPGEIEAAFAMLARQQIGALVVGDDFANQRDQLVALAACHSIPAIYSFRAAVYGHCSGGDAGSGAARRAHGRGSGEACTGAKRGGAASNFELFWQGQKNLCVVSVAVIGRSKVPRN